MPAAEINAIHMADARCPAEVPVAGGSLAKTVSVKDSVSVIDSPFSSRASPDTSYLLSADTLKHLHTG